ncbi:hypothetical protein PSHT_08412 [Puccinia striiformis]|uniref:Uncharacterized protein n=1 Tax=Puccinia striiformis TaxID=27350 RepID=A0A2S4VPU6_9BASI|nr:hypothetical protein PSHT_08412 [Puccinia striiformis]
MAGTSPKNNSAENLNSNRGTPSARQLQNEFAELERSLPPLPDLGRTYSRRIHRLESGSIPQRCEHVGDLTSASIQRFDPSASSYRQASVEPLPVYGTAVNPYPDHREQTDDPRRDSDERRDSSRDPSDDDGRRRIRSPFRNRQVYAGPPMAPVSEPGKRGTNLDENGYQSSHRRKTQEELTFLKTSRREATNRTTPMPVQSQVVPMEVSTPHIPTANPHTSVQPHQFQRGNNPTNNPSRAPRTRRQTPDITFLGRTHSVTREPLLPPHPPQIQPPTLHQVYQEQPVIIRPAMHPQTYANQHINPQSINNRTTPSTPILTRLIPNHMDKAAAEDGDEPIRP